MRKKKEKAKCYVDDCGRSVVARGLCGKHYQRKRTHGDVNVVLTSPPGSGSMSHGYRVHWRKGRHVPEHVLIAEATLGRPLPEGVEVHHVNEIRHDNSHGNLVICPNHAYHHLLHVRQRALDACGRADFRKCNYCGEYDDPGGMFAHPTRQSSFWHVECRNEYRRRKWAESSLVAEESA